jgi:hypothetical protein
MSRANRGGVLIVALVAMVVAVTVAYSAASVATTHREDVLREDRELQARALADAGVNRAIAFVKDAMRLSPARPFDGLDKLLFTNGDPAQPVTYAVAADEALQRNGRTYGTFTVAVAAVMDGDARDVTITATGYVPSRARAVAKETVQAVVRFGVGPGRVFDYAYFVNNWGWFFGDPLNAYGNVGANGPMESFGMAPGGFGTPRYDSLSLANPAAPDLVGYHDDNGDGVMDGTDGGLYAGWKVADAASVRGIGGQAQNQHSYVEPTPMPNLSDLSPYESMAVASGGTLALSNGLDAYGVPLPPTIVSNGVLGDEPGELQNVVLIGTTDKPILLDGPVVVRGSVIIKGVVSGRGAIYSGGNVYIADDLTYLDPPSTLLPDSESEGDTETWLAANQDKDFLGLFAREHVAMGDISDPWWQSYMDWWMSNPMNESSEDSGADQIPWTQNGMDGVPNTEDDDALEGDHKFTVEEYTQAQFDLGLVPPGKNVGDPIPGSGEDIDGDGDWDKTATVHEFKLPAQLDSGEWAGNLPAGTTSYSEISSIVMTKVQATLYTNHTAALLTLAWDQPFELFGSLVSRNESLIYGTSEMNLVHDRRLAGGGGLFGNLLPQAPIPMQILAWQRYAGDLVASLQ